MALQSSVLLGVALSVAVLPCGVISSGGFCPDNDYKWICDIEHGWENQTYLLEAKVYRIDKQYQLPQGTRLRGQGPGQTFIHAVGTPSKYGCTSHVKNRIGLLTGDNTYIGGFTFRGIEVQRWLDCLGGGAIETPGCADNGKLGLSECAGPNNTGNTNGAAVSNVLVENVEIATKDGKPTVQTNFWMAPTRAGGCNNVTIRNLSSNGSWADGLNVHGAHTNVLIESCNIGNSGDDVFAMWSEGKRMTNVTFRNNIAFNPTYPWNASTIPTWGANHVNCFAAYGGSGQLRWLGNKCTPAPTGILPPAIPHQWNDTGVVVFHTNFGGSFDPESLATILGNSYINVTAAGAPVRSDFPICNWARDARHGAPRLAQPHDGKCIGTTLSPVFLA